MPFDIVTFLLCGVVRGGCSLTQKLIDVDVRTPVSHLSALARWAIMANTCDSSDSHVIDTPIMVSPRCGSPRGRIPKDAEDSSHTSKRSLGLCIFIVFRLTPMATCPIKGFSVSGRSD